MENKKKPRKIQQFKVFFHLNGDLCEGQYQWMINHPTASAQYKTEDNIPFADTLEYDGFHGATGGNSHILFKSIKNARRVSMFMSDFDEVIRANRFIDQRIVGLFCYCKKNTKQGVRLILEDIP